MKESKLMDAKQILVKIGKEIFEEPYSTFSFVDDPEANDLLNDLENNPHAFVIACFLDRLIKSERAWMIPYRINRAWGTFDIKILASKSLSDYKQVFKENSLHRFNDKMAENCYKAIQRIHLDYDDNASNIWANKPSSARVVYRFLEFEGVGIKIATMATNLLARVFKVQFSDYYSIDVSPDVHVKRIMKRIGLVDENADNDKIIYKAREINPTYPGIIDIALWKISRELCKATKCDCEKCKLSNECIYNLKRNLKNSELKY